MAPALLFDLDGTLLNSDPIHVGVFIDIMKPHGIEVTEAFYASHIHGRMNVDFFAEFLPDLPDPQALSDEKEAEYRRRLPRPYPAMPGAVDLVRRAKAEGWPRAVVTNAMRANADAMLDAIGLSDAFDVVVIGEECARGKPHPDPYLAAMDALGIGPNRAIAFEDSPSGLRAAAASGALTIGLRSTLDDTSLRAAGADHSIEDFNDPALAAILNQFEREAAT